jgi:hypothetical protein
VDDALIRERLIGTWKLVSVVREDLASGARTESFGPHPVGFINYGTDGRMIVINVRSDRRKPAGLTPTHAEKAALYDSMLAYAGSYAINSGEVVHQVDASWNETYTGLKLVRVVRFEGNRVHLSTHPAPDPIDGAMCVRTITWEKLG